MASEVVCGLIFRVLLPVCLAAGESLHQHLSSRAREGLGAGTRRVSVPRQVRVILRLPLSEIPFELSRKSQLMNYGMSNVIVY